MAASIIRDQVAQELRDTLNAGEDAGGRSTIDSAEEPLGNTNNNTASSARSARGQNDNNTASSVRSAHAQNAYKVFLFTVPFICLYLDNILFL